MSIKVLHYSVDELGKIVKGYFFKYLNYIIVFIYYIILN